MFLPSIYSRMKTTKTKAQHVQVIMDLLFSSLMRAACIKSGEDGGVKAGGHICTIPDSKWKNQRKAFFEQNASS